MIVKTVGRSSENDIVISDASVSRVHLQLVCDDQGNVSVVDLGSANGTFVNGKRISSETRLKTGDELRIGNTVLKWEEHFPHPTTIRIESTTPSTKLPKGDRKRRKLWLFIVLGVLAVLIAVATLLFINRQNESKEAQQRQKEEIEYSKLERESLTAARDAARAAAEYEEAMKIAAKSNSERDQRRADSLKAVYESLKKELNDKEAALKKAEREKEAALKAKADAEKEKKDALEKAKADAEKEKKDALEKAKADAEKEKKDVLEKEKTANKLKDEAEQKLKDAEEKAKLKDDLYKELNKARSDDRLKEVCEALNIGLFLKSSDNAKYDAIVNEFDKAPDNNKRKEIINKIKSAKKGKKKDSDKTESDANDKSDNK